MPEFEYPTTNREWAVQKGLLLQCWKHRDTWYSRDGQCPECQREKEATAKAAKEKEAAEKLLKREETRKIFESLMKLEFCPKCRQKSLAWNTSFGLYECLNRDCRKAFAKDEIHSV
jgi:hypothetical protein